MKKGKIVSMPANVDTQIRTRARNLPIDRCYINENWEEAGMAHVIVSRKHINGNISYGLYFVDLMLLGVKDCFYAFNQSPELFDEMFDDLDDVIFVECEYALAHNIIYEGIAFAEEYGFKPAKDFIKTGKYILEEDTDDFPKMDIPLGEDGMPVVFITPEDNMQREIAILENTIGIESFIVYHLDEDGNILENEDDFGESFDFDDDDDDYYSHKKYLKVFDEILAIGIEKYMNEYRYEITPVQQMAITDYIYEKLFGDQDDEQLYQLIMDDDRFDPDLLRLPELDKYTDALQSIVDKMIYDKDAALTEMETLVAKHPDDVHVGITQIVLLSDLYMEQELEQRIRYWYERAPEHYAVRLYYAGWLAEKERFDEVFELFGNHSGLDALTTENVPFTDSMVCNFCACYVMAWLSKDNIEKAEPYYQLLLDLEYVTPYVRNAFLMMTSKKQNAIVEIKS